MVAPGDPPLSDPEHERAAEEAAQCRDEAAYDVEAELRERMRTPDVAVRPLMPGPVHLGDGVYASFDGYHVNLAVNDHRNHAVALDPDVLRHLMLYANRCGIA